MYFALSSLPSLIDALQEKRILIIGDVMLDAYLFGEATRISPEAPVPVVRISGEKYLLGGAGNVARNIAALGGRPTLIGQIGRDAEGEKCQEMLASEGIQSGLFPSCSRRTTIKTRLLAGNQQVVRLDKEDTSPFTDEENRLLLDMVGRFINDHDIIVLSDYAKGCISSAFMQGLEAMLKECPHQPKILVDPKPSHIGLYSLATLLTPNAKETSECASLPTDSPEEIIKAGRAIISRTHIPYLLTTLGAEGMALFASPNEIWHIPTFAQKVFDVTGAGDTVIATLALALAAGGELLPSCILANAAAGIVVASVGATTVSREQLKRAIETMPPPSLSRWR